MLYYILIYYRELIKVGLFARGFIRDVVTREFEGSNGKWEKYFVILEDLTEYSDGTGLSTQWVSLAGKSGQVEELAEELESQTGVYIDGLEVRVRPYGDGDEDFEVVTFRNCVASASFDKDHPQAEAYKEFLAVDAELRDKRSEAYQKLTSKGGK